MSVEAKFKGMLHLSVAVILTESTCWEGPTHDTDVFFMFYVCSSLLGALLRTNTIVYCHNHVSIATLKIVSTSSPFIFVSHFSITYPVICASLSLTATPQ